MSDSLAEMAFFEWREELCESNSDMPHTYDDWEKQCFETGFRAAQKPNSGEIRLPKESERSVLEHLYAYVKEKDLQDGKYVERALYRLIQQSTEREIGEDTITMSRDRYERDIDERNLLRNKVSPDA